ncbi:MAG: putative DsbA family dithiol-disulfide isomerase [Desulforhopalus sp.]|jgi:predicted DsbA family dithiol-disulfide isomerase
MFNTTQERIEVMVGELQKTAHSLDLPFNARTKTYNTRLAQELGLWAEDQGMGDAFHMAAFHAYFADGINLAQIPELIILASSVGLDTQEAQKVLSKRSYKQQVDLDWADSRLKAVTAVPTFIMGQHKLTGAQDYAILEELVNLYQVPLNPGKR